MSVIHEPRFSRFSFQRHVRALPGDGLPFSLDDLPPLIAVFFIPVMGSLIKHSAWVPSVYLVADCGVRPPSLVGLQCLAGVIHMNASVVFLLF